MLSKVHTTGNCLQPLPSCESGRTWQVASAEVEQRPRPQGGGADHTASW